MMMNPRVKAIEDAKDGKVNHDQWNESQPLSEADENRFWYLKKYLDFVFILVSYLYFQAYAHTAPFKQINAFLEQHNFA